MIIGTLLAELGVDTKGLTKASGEVKKFANTGEKSMTGVTKSVSILQKSIIGLAGVGGLLLLGRAFKSVIKDAAAFEKGIANVATLVDTSVVNMEELSRGILDMSVQVTKSTDDLNAGLFQVISAGIDSAEALDVLRVAAVAASAGVTDTASSVKAITGILNAYGLEANEATHISDLLFQTNKFGVTTFGELANSIGTVIPSAASLGIELEDLFASIATLTKANIDTRTATTALRAVFLSILKPTDDAKRTAKELGLEWDAATLSSKGLVQFINDMRDATKGNTEQMALLIPEARALTAVLALAGKQSETFNNIQREMFNATNATTEAFEKQEATFANVSEKIGIKIDQLKIKAGSAFLPIFKEVLDDVLDLTTALENSGAAIEQFFGPTSGVGALKKESEFIAKLNEELKELDLKKRLEGLDFQSVEALLQTGAEGLRDLALETAKVEGANFDLAEAMEFVANQAVTTAEKSVRAWSDVSEKTREALESLGLVIGEQFEAEAKSALNSFKEIAEAQELSNEDRVNLQEALFAKLETLAGIDPKTALGFDPEEALSFLQEATADAADNLFTTTKAITGNTGKLITNLGTAIEKESGTISVTLRNQAIEAGDFITQTENLVNEFITTATNNEISAFNARLNGVEEYTNFTAEAERIITEITGDNWDIREGFADDYFQRINDGFANAQNLLRQFQLAQSALPTVEFSVGEPVLGGFEHGGKVPQDGLFRLHAGEEVIPESQTANDNRKIDQSVHQDIAINVFGENAYEQAQAMEDIVRLQGRPT
jgi:TP901 family phage tail tape measure protein